MSTVYELHIHGMSCKHCVQVLTQELNAISGVEVLSVDIGIARIAVDDTLRAHSMTDVLHQAVSEAGFTMTLFHECQRQA
ncbi:MAG: heavy-metal-associated domain-containing protein [Candidatus Kapabacteria bacterium]|nr:heavy-metal-associated domain-containing protein [Candidatus Kapabacteria bacterium]